MAPYETLAVSNPDDLVFGHAPRPVSCGFDLTIGAGQVYPEVNFTLPAIMVSAENWSEIVAQYTEMVTGIMRRAVALQAPGIVLEFELLLTGCPISMEGRSATCAHFSPMGNVASAMCDLWSNESVQNVRLLSGNAPEAYAELLIYDCRLMNIATERGGAHMLRDWLTASDRWLSPQAAVLSPEATIEIAAAIVGAKGHYQRTLAAGRAAISILRGGLTAGAMQISAREHQWLDRIERELCALPENEEDLRDQVAERYDGVFAALSYGLGESD
jgi:hypothetical protein